MKNCYFFSSSHICAQSSESLYVCICNHIKNILFTHKSFCCWCWLSKNWKWIVFYMFYVRMSDIWVFVMSLSLYMAVGREKLARTILFLLYFTFFSYFSFVCEYRCQINLNLLTFYAAYFTSFISNYALTHRLIHDEYSEIIRQMSNWKVFLFPYLMPFFSKKNNNNNIMKKIKNEFNIYMEYGAA